MRYLIIIFIFTHSVFAEEIVLNANPISKVTSNIESTSREELTTSSSNEFRILITKHGNEYLWSTRNSHKLSLVQSGAFTIFVSDSGSGYIEIFDTSYLPDQDRTSSGRYLYKEHIRHSLRTITYWGVTDNFSP